VANLWNSLLRRGMRVGFDRGILGGSPPWLVLGALALLAHLAGRAMQRDTEVVLRANLKPDEVFEIQQLRR
jgi:hypothetical protein